jgi:predicted HNH restriction endonuclease
MPIPDDDTLQSELLEFLVHEPEEKATVWRVYEQLALLHPELTEAEKTEKYQNSASLWANRVQFARLHLANAGLLYRANAVASAPRNVWKLTPRGVERARALETQQANSVASKALAAVVEADLQAAEAEVERWEGKRTERLVAHYERNPQLRAAAIQLHGTTCKACGFNFLSAYGHHGANYIEVHHLVPVATLGEPSVVNPRTDMTVLCSNCHRMVHRKRDRPLSPIELRDLVAARK